MGVVLQDGGKITNGSTASTGALISGVYCRNIANNAAAASTVANFGTIDGVVLSAGGKITNGSTAAIGALIRGEIVVLNGTGTVTNLGTIANGLALDAGGRITNGSAAVTSSYCAGVYIGSFGTAGTVTNFGTISGSPGFAVKVAAHAVGKLVVEPGAVFVGSVLGGGSSRIDFETAGAADMSGVSGFKTIALGNGMSHALTLTDPNFAAVAGAAITVDDGDSGNTLTAATLPAADHIIGHTGVGLDTLTGGAGNDVFYAGGDAVMTGGAGRNRFIFSAPGNNTVGDFAVSASNEIVFSDKGFNLGLSGASGTPQALPAGFFVENSDGHFTETGECFAYATGTGDLFYSAPGSSGTPALVSHFTNAPALAASQPFFIS